MPRPVDLTFPCVWRGGVVSTVGCTGCGGGLPPLAVHDCRIHRECTVERVEPGVAWCGRCVDRNRQIHSVADDNPSAIEAAQNTANDNAAGQKNRPDEMYFENAARSMHTAPLR